MHAVIRQAMTLLPPQIKALRRCRGAFFALWRCARTKFGRFGTTSRIHDRAAPRAGGSGWPPAQAWSHGRRRQKEKAGTQFRKFDITDT